MQANKLIQLQILIDSDASRVWAALTQPELIEKWMLDTPVEIHTEWRQGGKLLERGDLHGLPFENRGKIIRFEPERILEYTHWSTLSQIADAPENYSVVRFEMQIIKNHSQLTLTVGNLRTFEIYKHLEFYWKTALHLLKEVAEF